MAQPQEASKVLEELELQSSILTSEMQDLDRRDLQLVHSAGIVLDKNQLLKKPSEATEATDSDGYLHKKFDLRTHSVHRTADGSSMSQFQRDFYAGGGCTLCPDRSRTMDLMDWDPVNHEKTRQRDPLLAKKERRDREILFMQSSNINKLRGQPETIVEGWSYFHTTDESDNESGLYDMHLPTRSFRKVANSLRMTHRQRIAKSLSLEYDDGDDKEENEENEEDEGEQGDDEMDLSEAVTCDTSGDVDSSYKESSSPAKVWHWPSGHH